MALQKFQSLFQDFVLPPKREYPRFQVVSLSQLDETNLESFLDQLIHILNVQHDISNTTNPHDKRRIMLNLQNNLIARGEGPGFRLAMSKDESVIGSKPVDVKKINKIVAAIAEKLQTSDLRQILSSLLDTYGILNPNDPTFPNLSELRKFKEDTLLTLNRSSQMFNPITNPVRVSTNSGDHYEIPDDSPDAPTSSPLSTPVQQPLPPPLPTSDPEPRKVQPSPVTQSLMLLAQPSATSAQSYVNGQNAPPTSVHTGFLETFGDQKLGPTCFQIDARQAQQFGMAWHDRIENIPEIQRSTQPALSENVLSSQQTSMAPTASWCPASSPQPVWVQPPPWPGKEQQGNWSTLNRQSTFQQQSGTVTSAQSSCPSSIQPVWPPHVQQQQRQQNYLKLQTWQSEQFGAIPTSNLPPQAPQFSFFQQNQGATGYQNPYQPPQFQQQRPYLHQSAFPAFPTMHTAPPPPLPTFHGDSKQDNISVSDFRKTFLALAPMYGTQEQAVLYLQSCLKDVALSWFKFHVARSPAADIFSILNAMTQQFSTFSSPMEKLKRVTSRVQNSTEPLQSYFTDKLRLIAQWNPALPEPDVCEFLWDGMQASLLRDTRTVRRQHLDNFMQECRAIEAENKRLASREKSISFSNAHSITLLDTEDPAVKQLREMLINQIGKKSDFQKSPHPARKSYRPRSGSTSRHSSTPGSKNSSHHGSRSQSAERPRSNSGKSSKHSSRHGSRQHSRHNSRERHSNARKDTPNYKERGSSSGNYRKSEPRNNCNCSCQKEKSKNEVSQR